MFKEDCVKVCKSHKSFYICPFCGDMILIPTQILIHGGRKYYCKSCKSILNFKKINYYMKKDDDDVFEAFNKLGAKVKKVGVLK